LVNKLQKEYQTSKYRESKAIEAARMLSGVLANHQKYMNALRKSYCAREVEIVEMREMIDELNGALQRANVSNQHNKSCRAIIDKLSHNVDSLL
jgi:hypothetical protein